MKIIDISQELFSCRIDFRDFPPTREQIKNIPAHKHNLTKITMSVHSGTHIDAPKHFLDDAKAVQELDLDIFYGDCSVVEFSGIIGENEIAETLKTCKERLIMKGNCELTDSGAAAIANSHIRLVGVESQSIGNAVYPMSVHLITQKRNYSARRA
jgi:arylformamidase